MSGSTDTVTARPTGQIRVGTRTVEVPGAWVGGTWVDASVLAHAHRSARGGFDFTVRSGEVADALVDHGFATRVEGRTLRGAGDEVVAAAAHAAAQQTPRPADRAGMAVVPEARRAEEIAGWCSSSHHLHPVPAVVEGRRARSDGDPWAERVRLCGRCADLLGAAGFFEAC